LTAGRILLGLTQSPWVPETLADSAPGITLVADRLPAGESVEKLEGAEGEKAKGRRIIA
jgi:hypothetical protein